MIPEQYQKPVFLSEPLGNNAFDFKERQKINPHPQLFIPALVEDTLKSARLGTQIVFEALNDQQEIQSCLGLQHFIFDQKTFSAPTYIFDNHNHAFFFWHWFVHCHPEFISGSFTLIHIDQHRDSRVPANFISEVESRNPDKVYQYARDFLNVGNFIPPAIKTGLIDQVIFLDSQKSLEEFNIEIVLNHNVILDIDLDFFSPDLDYIGNDLKIKTIQQLIPHAKLITIATSPFFINQELALEKLNMLL